MSAETQFRLALVNDAALTALVGSRVALNAVPEGAVMPLVVFTAAHDRTLGLNNELLADLCTFSVQCWGTTAAQADAVADAVIAAIATLAPAASGACVIDRASAFDAEIGFDGTTLTVEWWA